MAVSGIRYAISHTTHRPFDETVEHVRAALAAEGFGVLCEVDVEATMRAKLGVEREPYVILGACNPPLAHEALTAEPDLGVFLPCNVVVYAGGGVTHVAAVDPRPLFELVGKAEVAPVADEVRARLERVVAAVV